MGGEYRFQGRVAAVTGAGRGLGRAYARLLAERGASVVVNDVGSSVAGDGTDVRPARTVAAEIVAAGGAAIAETSDVSTPEGGRRVIDAALEAFGRIDILINNAGTVRWMAVPQADAGNLQHHLAVHVMGSFNTTRAAWPHMTGQGYGRIVMTASTGIFGRPDGVSYGAAKAAVIGMSRGLAVAGAGHGIKVNLIAPNAYTRMAGQREPGAVAAAPPRDLPPMQELPPELGQQMPPEPVASVAAFLAHEACPANGEIYVASGGRVARIFIGVTGGYVQPDTQLTIEDVRDNWAAINDEGGYYVPADVAAWMETFSAHLKLAGPG